MVREAYFKPAQIRYRVEDVMWVIATVLPMEEGYWPPEPETGGYAGKMRTVSCVAPFEASCQVRAEVSERLRMTKDDGETLLWEIQRGGVEYYPVLCPAARKALLYISSGWRRRRQTYALWKADRKRQRQKIKP
ncbi:MAG: hypothetical protein A9183_02975 [Dehalococcoides mccartyi]|uniref:hypothetical protein n=1 Tax=Dehalococcoides mccartyi TaxID=61435 RepID=UPI000804F465|nr:hypothetical protein [Dehalococcoides mccartyi]OBW61083.1 MAG: hypothetical protein A9183_02975 [Dehalococcoides mccartyi]